MLQSPGIQIFESSVTPSAEIVTSTNGVATLGYSTRGPLNKLVRLESLSDFANIFGKPLEDQPHAHILANNVLSQNSVLYFMRIGSSDAKKATCAVTNADFTSVNIAIAEPEEGSQYFTVVGTAEAEFDGDPIMRVTVEELNGASSIFSKSVDVKMKKDTRVVEGEETEEVFNIIKTPVYSILSALSSDKDLDALYTFNAFINSAKPGIVVSKKDKLTEKIVNVAVKFGRDVNGVFTGYDESLIATKPVIYNGKGLSPAEWNGYKLSDSNSHTGITEKYHFLISAKNPGSGMDGVRVVKSEISSAMTGAKTWTIRIIDADGILLETIGAIDPADFANVINDKSQYIEILKIEEGDEESENVPEWKDGTYVLAKGMLLEDGSFYDVSSSDYKAVSGTNGDSEDVDVTTSYYVSALNSADFKNCDENTFSVLATPASQEYLVQQAAIEVCEDRGDTLYLVDTPYTKCEMLKDGISEIVDWSNSNPSFVSSYAAIYYGWFSQVNPYNTTANIWLPASVFIAPKMMVLDNTVGEYYPPAGVQNGTLAVADYVYSPDQADRDLMVGDNNVVNPIIYSNTRGVIAFAQRTTDRSTSPLNRVGIRRMTNAIKRQLRSTLQEIVFRPNNEYSRARARKIVDNAMSGLQSGGMIESYSINVVSGTGAARNDLYIYLNFAPFGLIEKIYVYVNISDAGIEVTEAVE